MRFSRTLKTAQSVMKIRYKYAHIKSLKFFFHNNINILYDISIYLFFLLHIFIIYSQSILKILSQHKVIV